MIKTHYFSERGLLVPETTWVNEGEHHWNKVVLDDSTVPVTLMAPTLRRNLKDLDIDSFITRGRIMVRKGEDYVEVLS